MTRLRLKRGDTLSVAGVRRTEAGVPVDLSGYQVRAQLRDGTDQLLANLTVTVSNPGLGEFQLSAPATTTEMWAPGHYLGDVEFTSSGGVVDSTDTFRLVVVADVTR